LTQPARFRTIIPTTPAKLIEHRKQAGDRERLRPDIQPPIMIAAYLRRAMIEKASDLCRRGYRGGAEPGERLNRQPPVSAKNSVKEGKMP